MVFDGQKNHLPVSMQIQYQIVFHDKLAKLVPFFQIRFSAFAIEIGLLSIGSDAGERVGRTGNIGKASARCHRTDGRGGVQMRRVPPVPERAGVHRG